MLAVIAFLPTTVDSLTHTNLRVIFVLLDAQEIEDGFHDYDTVCESCEISRQPDANLPPCPTAVCDDNSGNEAYKALINAGCSTTCDSNCAENYRILRAVHDTCDHDALSQEAEEGIHDVELACAMHNCNTGTDDSLTCDEEPHSSAATGSLTAAAAVVAAALVVL